MPAVGLDSVSHRLLLAGLLGPRADAIGRVRDDHVEITFGQGAVERERIMRLEERIMS